MTATDILTFLNSKDKTLILHMAPGPLFDELKSVNVDVDHDNMETNGWEVDWWVDAKYKKQKLHLSGSAWYGNAKIEKTK